MILHSRRSCSISLREHSTTLLYENQPASHRESDITTQPPVWYRRQQACASSTCRRPSRHTRRRETTDSTARAMGVDVRRSMSGQAPARAAPGCSHTGWPVTPFGSKLVSVGAGGQIELQHVESAGGDDRNGDGLGEPSSPGRDRSLGVRRRCGRAQDAVLTGRPDHPTRLWSDGIVRGRDRGRIRRGGRGRRQLLRGHQGCRSRGRIVHRIRWARAHPICRGR
jgi:hypothetical protein